MKKFLKEFGQNFIQLPRKFEETEGNMKNNLRTHWTYPSDYYLFSRLKKGSNVYKNKKN